MSVQVKPLEQLEMRGVFTAGHPLQRPRNTAAVCQDFRVMPGNYLRLRGGRMARWCIGGSNDLILQIAPFRRVDFPGSDSHLAQVKWASGVCEWHWFSLGTYVILPSGSPGTSFLETIATTYDSSFAATGPVAVCNLDDRPVFYNGLGVRDGIRSRPPFTHALNGSARYFGLDAYCPGALPTCSFAAGAGYNSVSNEDLGVRLYVGLYNSASEHYSNGVPVGSIEATEGSGTISVNGLGGLSYAAHNVSEQSELFYVFYATIDGGAVPYLILNSTLDGPFKVSVGSSSASLSIADETANGWVLDLSKEMPIENFPPRPMRSIAYVNGRLYGSLMMSGSGAGVDFHYTPTARELAAVVWCAAASDSQEKDFLGDPLQSWPFFNIAYTPSGDQPLVVAPADDATRVLVITSTSCFYLEEAADGIHEYTTISRIHGITKPSSLVASRHGTVWMDQRNQVVLLRPGSREVEVISATYQDKLAGTVTCADYVYDPSSEIDRYQVWFSGGTSVCHDFRTGEAYTATNQDFTAARTVTDSFGRLHHMVAKNGVYTQERQPSGGIITFDQTFTGVGQTAVNQEISGIYVRNWDDFGDSDVRKEMPILDIIGDVTPIEGVPPLAVDYWPDFARTLPSITAVGASVTQSATLSTFRYKLPRAMAFWYKVRFRLTGRSNELAYYPEPSTEGDNAKNFYGSILRVLWRLGVGENRQ